MSIHDEPPIADADIYAGSEMIFFYIILQKETSVFDQYQILVTITSYGSSFTWPLGVVA